MCSDEYPGVLLPSFLNRLIDDCAKSDSSLLGQFVLGTVSAVCGRGTAGLNHQLESVTTCKWILAVFSVSSAQETLLGAAPCLFADHLLALRSFLQV